MPDQAACSCRGREYLQSEERANKHSLQASDDSSSKATSLCVSLRKWTSTGTIPAFSSMFETRGSSANHLNIVII